MTSQFGVNNPRVGNGRAMMLGHAMVVGAYFPTLEEFVTGVETNLGTDLVKHGGLYIWPPVWAVIGAALGAVLGIRWTRKKEPPPPTVDLGAFLEPLERAIEEALDAKGVCVPEKAQAIIAARKACALHFGQISEEFREKFDALAKALEMVNSPAVTYPDGHPVRETWNDMLHTIEDCVKDLDDDRASRATRLRDAVNGALMDLKAKPAIVLKTDRPPKPKTDKPGFGFLK